MGLLDDIRKALEGEMKSEFIDQILKEKALYDALHDAGYSIVVDDVQARARQQPYGILSKVLKIDLVDLITEITKIKSIDLVAVITDIMNVASVDLIDRITLIDAITDISNIASIDLIDRITLIDTITAITNIANIASLDLIDLITRIALIDRITLIDTITSIGSIGSMTLLDRITQIDKIHPDTSPIGEQMTNGGFETGDLTGWTSGGTVVVGMGSPHTGVYGCLTDDFPILPWIEQDIATLRGYSIPVENITSFSLWACEDSGTGNFTVLITYSDATTTNIPLNTILGIYEEFDLLPYLDTTKEVSKINISTTNSGMSYKIWFDDISLVADAAHTVIDRVKKIDSMPAITGTVTVANLDVLLSTRALEAGGNLAAILAQLDSKTSTLFKATQNIGNTTFGATQATRTSLKVQPEREDIVSLGGVASPNAAGVQIVAASGSLVPKVYDAEYEGLADGLHYFYFGTDTNPTTKRFLSRNTKGVNSKTFVQPRVGAAGDGIYLYASVSETNMPYDLGYRLE
jgi:hypothetical protein